MTIPTEHQQHHLLQVVYFLVNHDFVATTWSITEDAYASVVNRIVERSPYLSRASQTGRFLPRVDGNLAWMRDRGWITSDPTDPGVFFLTAAGIARMNELVDRKRVNGRLDHVEVDN